MSTKKLLFIFLLGLLHVMSINAQVVSEGQARAELQKRGISETELRAALLTKGIDLDKINPTDSAELQRVQRIIEETVTELEQQKKQVKTSVAPSGSNEAVANESTSNTPAQPVNSTPATPVLPEVIAPTESDKPVMNTPIYGQGIFKGGNMKVFNKVEDGRASGAYILGPGDIVSVSIWGASVINTSQTIGKEGYIQPEGMPRLFLSGLTVTEAEKIVKASYSRRAIFNNQDFSFNVVSPRNINVNIYGEVGVNGTFYISALNTAFNALVAAGGLTDLGSVRKITLQRAGSKPRRLDVYEFLNNPILANEFFLQENDFIHVPAAEKLVRISGAVIRPSTYELLPDEKLSNLIKFAGGTRANALLSGVQLKRIENGAEKIIDINYDEVLKSNQDISLLNGDEINIKVIVSPVENIVSVEGAVYYPDEYAVTTGTKVSEIVKRAQLRENALTSLAYLRRTNDDKITVRYQLLDVEAAMNNPSGSENIEVKNGDVIIIKAKSEFAIAGKASIEGAVNRPSQFNVNEGGNLTLKDAIFISAGLKEDATKFGYLFRTDPKNLENLIYKYLDLNDEQVLALPLLPGDNIKIFSQSEYTDATKVEILGAVRNPNSFVYNASLSLKDLIILAGGLRLDAAPNKIDVYRVDFDQNRTTKTIATSIDIKNSNIFDTNLDFKLQPYDKIVVRQAPAFSLQRSVTIDGEVVYPGPYSAIQENTRLSTVIKQAGGLTNEAYDDGATIFRTGIGFVVVNLKKALLNPGSIDDFILENGDLISIPRKNSLISIDGAVNIEDVLTDVVSNQGRAYFAYEGPKSAKYYVNEYAGGFKHNAKKSSLIVEHQNGKISKTKKFLFFNVYPKLKPGSKITVPYKVEKAVPIGGEKEDVDWGKVLSSSVAQATAVLSLILLLRAVN